MKQNKKNVSEDSDCINCQWFDEEENTCIAFPQGIPDDFLNAVKHHDKPTKHQFGELVFTKKPFEK